jgi:hypothetical protein
MSHGPLYLDNFELSLRGWTRALRNRFLPKPDTEIRINHWLNYSCKPLYDVERVIFLEARADFVAAFAASVARRKLSPETLAHFMANRRMDNDLYKAVLRAKMPEVLRRWLVVP